MRGYLAYPLSYRDLNLAPLRVHMARDALLIKWVGAMLGRGTMPLGEIMDAAMLGFPGVDGARATRQDQADGRFEVQSLARDQVAQDG